MIPQEDKKTLLELARNAITCSLLDKPLSLSGTVKSRFEKKQGVFVTLRKSGSLRGCIGFVEPFFPLYDAVVEAAKSAAFKDPRFDVLTNEELNFIKIEISVLSDLSLITVRNCVDYLELIKIGKHGLVIRSSKGRSGLLLPQVPVEQKWDVVGYLEALCEKASLDRDAWRYLENKIYCFECEVFSED
jgi:uncharacterized protein